MIKIFADTADFDAITKAAQNPLVKGFTTNPTLLKKAGVTNYKKFVVETVAYLKDTRPDTCISFEVFGDDENTIEHQAATIHNWIALTGYLVYIKIPVVNTQEMSLLPCIDKLANMGVSVNVTAVFTKEQLTKSYNCLRHKNVESIISVFAGRLYDIGQDPIHILQEHRNNIEKDLSLVETLWASPRQVYDYYLAKNSGCDIITMTPELIDKLVSLKNKLALDYCLDTVKMFYEDGQKSGLTI